ncbi:hypothetical protein [Paenibacillus fonticola]|uniref:hypothetical protein n=1 Tax=Paenibacillus fonticola TaxID=379896 RepID=UPI000361DE0B|nr:hypothetical protein [Paenibacillus fonticola]
MKMRGLYLYFSVLLVLLAATAGCGGGSNRIAKEELDRVQMKTYRKGNIRQLNQGKTLNNALLQNLQAECAKRGIRLTKGTYADSLDGTISYSYLIESDPRHFVIVYVYPSESVRIREMAEIYGDGIGIAQGDNRPATRGAAVISARGRTAIVYGSSGQTNMHYHADMKAIFEGLLERISNP